MEQPPVIQTGYKPKVLEVIKLDAKTWEVFINGDQTGQYPSAAAAKAAAKRRLPATASRLEWKLWSDDHWRATA